MVDGLKVLLHIVASFFTLALGIVAWAAPHLDWSHVKDESPWSYRGLVVLGMMVFALAMQMWAGLLPPQKHGKRKS